VTDLGEEEKKKRKKDGEKEEEITKSQDHGG